MRELKFRVYDKQYKEFRYWGFVEPGKGIFVGLPSNSNLDLEYCREHSQQFTGLLDTKGKEIWEGDVVETITRSAIKEGKRKGEIKYADEWASFYFATTNKHGCGIAFTDVFSWYYGDGDEIIAEVIGNIYEG